MSVRDNCVRCLGMALVLACFGVWGGGAAFADGATRIQPYGANPFYWQYEGEPVLLLGGSGQDNLFNNPTGLEPGDTLETHLDLLVSAGGNYVRNTMSARDAGNVFPFHRDPDTGLFDLDRFNTVYWERLDTLLTLAKDRSIIVQIELWDPHDYYQLSGEQGGWSLQPFNPANNVNYTFAAIWQNTPARSTTRRSTAVMRLAGRGAIGPERNAFGEMCWAARRRLGSTARRPDGASVPMPRLTSAVPAHLPTRWMSLSANHATIS